MGMKRERDVEERSIRDHIQEHKLEANQIRHPPSRLGRGAILARHARERLRSLHGQRKR